MKWGAVWVDSADMAPVSGTSSIYAAALSGFQRALQRTAAAANSITSPGALSPVDSVEFSDAARNASTDSIAAAAVDLSQARTETAAMALIVKTQERMDRQAIDLLA